MITISSKDVDKLVARVYVDTQLLANFGQVATRTHLTGMKEQDFIVQEYEDKNKTISHPVQDVGKMLLNRGLYDLTERYWMQVDEEILAFNTETGRRVNRGIPLGNIGVAQLAQDRTIEGLSSIYIAYQDDIACLQHLPGVKVDAETEVANSPLYTQFEKRTVSMLYDNVVLKFKAVFKRGISKNDLDVFLSNLKSDRKLLLYIIMYRFLSAWSSDQRYTTFISRAELLRSLADLAVWFEAELKRKTRRKSGTLVEILANRIRAKFKMELNPTSGQYTKASTLNDLKGKISDASSTSDPIQIQNARIAGCVRNFTGHNLEVATHKFFESCDEVFARMLSLMLYAKGQKWIKTS